MKAKVYISISITGHDYESQKRQAKKIQRLLTESDIDSITPFDIITDSSTPYGAAMGECIRELINNATHILMLPGWETSSGCKLEFKTAEIYNKRRLFFDDYRNHFSAIRYEIEHDIRVSMELEKFGLITLANDDCINVIRTYPDNYFNLAIVDPPYGIGTDKPSKKPDKVKQRNGNYLSVTQPIYEHKGWDVIPNDEYFNELKRVSKHQIIFGANYFGLKGGMIVWDKLNGRSDQYGCEIAYQSFNKRTDIVYYMWAGMFQGKYCGEDIKQAIVQQGNKKLNEKRIHPTQKPVLLYKYLIEKYSDPGDKILDTHVGSGSICIAAHELGREILGIELDKEYYEKTKNRILNYLSIEL